MYNVMFKFAIFSKNENLNKKKKWMLGYSTVISLSFIYKYTCLFEIIILCMVVL